MAAFFQMKNLVFAFGLVKMDEVSAQLFIQVPSSPDDIAFLQTEINPKISVLLIAQLQARVFIETAVDIDTGRVNFEAFFGVQASVDVLVGTVKASIEANADVTSFTFDQPERNRFLEESNVMDFRTNSSESGALAVPRRRTLSGFSLENADWSLKAKISFDARSLEEIGKLVGDALKNVFSELSNLVDGVLAVAEDVVRFISDAAAKIGGVINDAIKATVEFLDGVKETIDAVVNLLDGRITGSLAKVAGSVASGVLELASSTLEAGAKLLKGDISGAVAALGEGLASTFGFSKKIKNKRLVTTSRRDEVFNCPLQHFEFRECKRTLGIQHSCKNKKTADFAEESCVKQRTQEMAKIDEAGRESQELTSCASNAKARNVGLEWFSTEGTSQDLGIEVAPAEQLLGKSSDIGDSPCKQVAVPLASRQLQRRRRNRFPFGTKPLSPIKERKSYTPAQCVDLSTETSFQRSIEKAQEEMIGELTATAANGQGVDDTLQTCQQKAQKTCDTPTLRKGRNFRDTVSVPCDFDWATLNYNELFGEVEVSVSSLCNQGLHMRWETLSNIDSEDDNCSPATVQIRRVGRDCCGNESNEFIHTLNIVPKQPYFTTPARTLDYTLDCAVDTFPHENNTLPVPQYAAGCADSFLELLSVDVSVSPWDTTTCTATFTRQWTVQQDDCEDLSATFEQVLTMTNDHAPIFGFLPPEVMKVSSVEEYRDLSFVGYPTAYQKCGAGEITLTFGEIIAPGGAIQRTWVARDICGHESRFTQFLDMPLNIYIEASSNFDGGQKIVCGCDSMDTACDRRASFGDDDLVAYKVPQVYAASTDNCRIVDFNA